MEGYTADLAWFTAYQRAIAGHYAVPRGMGTFEVLHATSRIDMRYPMVINPARKLSYRFAAAEALWILEGSNRLSDLTAFNPRMADYSDDGETLAGAYGPRIALQLNYVLQTLCETDTRQATLTIWAPNPTPSKDIPCTLAMDFKIRGDRLHTSVFMRSSDVWLGLPYDIFSFCCVSYKVIGMMRRTYYPQLTPGFLHVTAASSHVYTRDADAKLSQVDSLRPAPEHLWEDPEQLHEHLALLTLTKKGDRMRWWEL